MRSVSKGITKDGAVPSGIFTSRSPIPRSGGGGRLADPLLPAQAETLIISGEQYDGIDEASDISSILRYLDRENPRKQ
jgi:hypothetical protein